MIFPSTSRCVAAVFSLLALTVSACSTPHADLEGGANDTGTSDAACTATITEVQARIPAAMAGQPCPARWEDLPATSPCPMPYGLAPRAGRCGTFLVYAGACSLDRFVCVYDNTTRALIGAAESTDTPAYCDRTASCFAAGTLPSEVQCTRDGLGFPDAFDAGTPTCSLTPLPTTASDASSSGALVTDASAPECSAIPIPMDSPCSEIGRVCVYEGRGGDCPYYHYECVPNDGGSGGTWDFRCQ